MAVTLPNENAHQLRVIRPVPAQTFVPQRPLRTLRPGRSPGPVRPVGCMRGLGTEPARLIGSSVLTSDTIQGAADHGGAAFRRLHPGPDLPRRLVPHVLRMAALELGYQVPFGVFVKADDPPSHTSPPGEIFVRVCLTACASAAGPQARARTNLRSLARSRRVPPGRRSALPAACRLHARVRHQRAGYSRSSGLAPS
jgi:hypothetical protein